MPFKLKNTEKTEDTYQKMKDRSEKRFRCSCGKSGALIEFTFTLFPEKSEAACIYCGKIHNISIVSGKMIISATKKSIDGNYMADICQ